MLTYSYWNSKEGELFLAITETSIEDLEESGIVTVGSGQMGIPSAKAWNARQWWSVCLILAEELKQMKHKNVTGGRNSRCSLVQGLSKFLPSGSIFQANFKHVTIGKIPFLGDLRRLKHFRRLKHSWSVGLGRTWKINSLIPSPMRKEIQRNEVTHSSSLRGFENKSP